MDKLLIEDLAPEIVELADDDLDLVIGTMRMGTGFVCSVTSGDAIGKPAEECHRV